MLSTLISPEIFGTKEPFGVVGEDHPFNSGLEVVPVLDPLTPAPVFHP